MNFILKITSLLRLVFLLEKIRIVKKICLGLILSIIYYKMRRKNVKLLYCK
ncbi:hypothetical protein HMPREF9184_01138 [Streptococcus sp. oral taxon 058 str. F0407]|nr:hypothetical protein HMPREF9184_01138 [Streptococcus sp. oral taxon 058 str. F0407]